MIDPVEHRHNPPPPAAASGFELNHPTIISLLYISAFVAGVTGLVGIVLAYIWRGDNPAAWEESHYTYLIRTFWIGLLGSVAGMVLSVVLSAVLIGIPIMVATAVWVVIRSVVSLLKAQKREPMPNPGTLGI